MEKDASRQIKTGAVLSYVALMLSMAVTLVYTPFMLRQLGQAEYGLFALVNTTIAYLTILDFGFGNAIVRYSAKYRAEQDKTKEESLHGMFLLLYIGIGFLAFFLALVLVFNVERLFSASLTLEELGLAKILMWLAAINLAMSFPFSVFSSVVEAYECFIFSRMLRLTRLIVNPLLMVLILVLGYKSVGLVVATTALNLFFNILNLYYCKKYLHIKMRFTAFDGGLFKEICGYSFFVFLNLIVDRLYWSTGQFLLGVFVGTAAVAVYSIGLQFVNSLYIPLSTATSGLFLPRVTQISLKETPKGELSDLFIKVGRIQFIILGLILSGFYLFGQRFVYLWAGPEYMQSYLIALILMVPLTIPLIQSLGISILQARNMHAFRSVVYLVIATANVAISIPLAKRWGPAGCAMGTSTALVVGQIIIMNIYYRSRMKLQITKFWLEVCKMIPAMLIALGAGMLIRKGLSGNNLVGLLANVISYTAAYCLIMYFIGMNFYEKSLILKPFTKLVARVGLSKVVL